jgi:hypothetical protein
VRETPRRHGPQKRRSTVDTRESSAPHAHPSAGDHDLHHDQDVLHACNDGWVTIGQIVVDPETGEETQEYALYLCRKCAERS